MQGNFQSVCSFLSRNIDTIILGLYIEEVNPDEGESSGPMSTQDIRVPTGFDVLAERRENLLYIKESLILR